MRIPRAVSLCAAPRRVSTITPQLRFSRRALNTDASGSKPSTYSNQGKLPRLPIPDLDKSLEAYVKSLVPLLEQKVSTVTAEEAELTLG